MSLIIDLCFSALLKAILNVDDDGETHGLTSIELIFEAGGKNTNRVFVLQAA